MSRGRVHAHYNPSQELQTHHRRTDAKYIKHEYKTQIQTQTYTATDRQIDHKQHKHRQTEAHTHTVVHTYTHWNIHSTTFRVTYHVSRVDAGDGPSQLVRHVLGSLSVAAQRRRKRTSRPMDCTQMECFRSRQADTLLHQAYCVRC